MSKSKRLSIIETAMDLFISNGFKATSMQKLADACGISKGAVYLHFKSKGDLMLAIMEHYDDQIHAELQRIRNDPTLSPRDQMRAQIRYLFQDVVENQGYFDVFLRESDLNLNDQVMTFLQKCRYDWQKSQEEFLYALYGDKVKPYLIDVGAMVNGIVGEYHISMLVEGIKIDLDLVADFIMAVVDAMVDQLPQSGVAPVLKPEMMPNRQRIEALWADQGAARAMETLEEMEGGADQLKLNPLELEEARASLALIRRELEAETPNKIIIQGMLANLRDINAWIAPRRRIARQLSIKLR